MFSQPSFTEFQPIVGIVIHIPVMALYLALILFFRPYRSSFLNTVETVSCFSLMMVCWAATGMELVRVGAIGSTDPLGRNFEPLVTACLFFLFVSSFKEYK